jgi:predicted MPP superfamily phosphohydrolase
MKRRTFIKSVAFSGFLSTTVSSIASGTAEKLTLAQLCDPQLGFGEGGFDADVKRLTQEINLVNELTPDVCVVAGDMVNDIQNKKAVKTFLELISTVKVPLILTAGNHDLPDPVTKEGLDYYRSHFGSDFVVRECRGRRIISANSQLWRESPQGESEQHQKLLQETLQKAKSKGEPVILLTHVPPFVNEVDEKDSYFNLAKEKRTELLQLFEDNGVILWLAGHTHRVTKHQFKGITILNGETTSRNFDKRPPGFRLLTIHSDNRFDWKFQPLFQPLPQ